MSLTTYLEHIKARTGKSPEDFRTLAEEKGLKTHREIVAWLKKDFGLGGGHAAAIASALTKGSS
jgi:hypothetical protein